MKFKTIKFPIRTSHPELIKNKDAYFQDIRKGKVAKRKPLKKILTYSESVAEKEVLRKINIINCENKDSYYVEGENGEYTFCRYCHGLMILQQTRKKNPRGKTIINRAYCPRCEPLLRERLCLWCERDTEYTRGLCQECLNFFNADQFNASTREKAKEIRAIGYNHPKKRIRNKCLEKNCKYTISLETNHWFCDEHWKEYKAIRDKFNLSLHKKPKRIDELSAQYNEQVNPRWIWREYLGPAMKEAKKGNFNAGQRIIHSLLNKHPEIPEYPLSSANFIMGDLCFFNKEYDRAISYYKKDNSFDIDRVFNARRLMGESMAGDELISLCSINQTDFFSRNRELVAQFAEEIAERWEKNSEALLNMGIKTDSKRELNPMSGFYRVDGVIGYNPYSDYLFFTNEIDNIEIKISKLTTLRKPDIDWYKGLLLEDWRQYTCYSEDTKFKRFRETIDNIVLEAENKAREYMGIKKRGEGWVSETELYYKIKELFSDYEVFHHYSPVWLGRQHLDIYVSDLKLAIEYQGRQHFEPIDFFGGVEALIETQKRDAKKKDLCEKHGVQLIYVLETDEFSEVAEAISNFSKEKMRSNR